MTDTDHGRKTPSPAGGDGRDRRWLRDLPLRWKLGLVVMLALVVGLTFVWTSFRATIRDAGQRLTAHTKLLAQDRTRAELSVKERFYLDLQESLHETVLSLTRRRDFFDTLHTSPGELGQRARKWLGPRIAPFGFLVVFDEQLRIVGGFAHPHDDEGRKRFVDLADRVGQVLPAVPLLAALKTRPEMTGTMVIPPSVLAHIGMDGCVRIPIRPTEKAYNPEAKLEERALALGSITTVQVVDRTYHAFGAHVFNRNHGFVDELRMCLYGWGDDAQSRAKRLASSGCATIFLDNLRVTTNVKDRNTGQRALGTLMSREVHDRVLKEGKIWSDRAFVVDAYWATAYEPIRDVFGKIVGSLFFGIPETHYQTGQQQALDHLHAHSFRSFLMALVLSTLVALLVGLGAASIIARPLVTLERCTRHVGEGRLGVQVPVQGRDEIGRLADGFRAMLGKLVELAGQVKSAAGEIGAATGTIEGTLQDHASTTSQQSAAVSETTATLEELAASSREIAENAMEVVRMASKTLESTRRGVEIGEETIAKMDEIQQVNEDDIERIRALSNKLRRIDEIMALINTIADQTKLIAFNAAIEAAAAGDAGRRFSVVSAEIRRLAENVREQADEIRNHVGEIQKSASELVVSREAGTKKVESGVAATRRVNASLQEICDDSERVLSNSKKISIATQQQRSATEQTLRAVREINDGVNQLATGAQQTGEVMHRLAELSEDLGTHVDRFEI